MAFILNIDTSLENALVNIADNGAVISEQYNPHQKNHAVFLETAIEEILKDSGIQMHDLAAIAVVAGPGSYTGLRIGMASVKALCYALQKPLILLNKLMVIAQAAIQQNGANPESSLYCPMIDARRMEVFSAIYNHRLEKILAPCAMVLENESFHSVLEQNQISFFGNGAAKWSGLCNHKNAAFIQIKGEGAAMAGLSLEMLYNQSFSDVGYAAPLYLKEFFLEVKSPI